jgi:hypothetical protein
MSQRNVQARACLFHGVCARSRSTHGQPSASSGCTVAHHTQSRGSATQAVARQCNTRGCAAVQHTRVHASATQALARQCNTSSCTAVQQMRLHGSATHAVAPQRNRCGCAATQQMRARRKCKIARSRGASHQLEYAAVRHAAHSSARGCLFEARILRDRRQLPSAPLVVAASARGGVCVRARTACMRARDARDAERIRRAVRPC